MQRLQNSFKVKEQQTCDPVEEHFGGDRDNPAITLKTVCDRRLVKNKRRFGSQQGANYRPRKHRYLNRKLRERRFEKQDQKKETNKKKEKDGPDCAEFSA